MDILYSTIVRIGTRVALGIGLRTAVTASLAYTVVPIGLGLASLTLTGLRRLFTLLKPTKPNPTITELVNRASTGKPQNPVSPITDWTLINHPLKNNQQKIQIHPIALPTLSQLKHAQNTAGYRNDTFHLAVAGSAGTGKSSLVNAFRGIPNSHPDAAQTGVVETTTKISRYSDRDAGGVRETIAWYDVPGAGTLSVPGWEYFNDMGLYIFDAIIVAVDGRLTEIDVEILRNSERYLIPTFIVRTKADVHVANMARDAGEEEEEEDGGDVGRYRKEFVELTRRNVAANLEMAGLGAQKVYVVSNRVLRAMYCAVRDGTDVPGECLDEELLMGDLFLTAYNRRCEGDD